jgi:hypothetical protein
LQQNELDSALFEKPVQVKNCPSRDSARSDFIEVQSKKPDGLPSGFLFAAEVTEYYLFF